MDGKLGIPISPDGRLFTTAPDFYHDLNAVHELVVAFKRSVNDGDRRWSDALMRVCQDAEDCVGAVEARYKTADATAPQRCEALLRTLNLWED